jgi:CoA:oxalate CoA-transferase
MGTDNRRILAGVRVCEIAQYFAGPIAGRMMADLGAEVVKLEMAPAGERLRAASGTSEVTGQQPSYVYWNRGKQSICVDIKRPEGAQIARDLIHHFDVVLENYTPGVLAKYGLDYETLKQVNPRLIMCSISGFGQTGPLSRLPGNDTVTQAMTGVTHLTGNTGGSPVYSGIYLADGNGAVNGLAAILGALYYREKTGLGNYIDLSLVEALFHLHDSYLVAHLFSGGEINPTRCGPHRDEAAPCGIFKARNGYVVINIYAHEFRQFAGVIGRPDLADDPRFADPLIRAGNKLALAAIIEEWLQSFASDEEPVKILQSNRFLSAPVLDLRGAVNNPHLRARGALQTVDVPGFGEIPLPKAPYHYSEAVVEIRPHMALLGQDNAEVLGKYLGYDAKKIAALTEEGLLVSKGPPTNPA